MKNKKFAFQTLVLAGIFLVFSAVANAQVPRTWISATGDDANPCFRGSPCKTLTGTISKTSVGGEIDCIDPQSMGTVTITKSVTINCEDMQGTISAAGATGITINITDPLDTAKSVRIIGVTINGMGTGLNGINVQAGNKLTLEEVVIDGFTTHGISLLNSSGAFSLVVKDSTIKNNAGNGINTFLSGAATAKISVESSLIAFNVIGLNIGLATTAQIENSGVTNNTTGLQASGSTSIMAVKDCVVSHNTTGVLAGSSAVVRIGSNIITANATGLSGTNIYTWGSNFIDGNTTANGTNNGNAASQ